MIAAAQATPAPRERPILFSGPMVRALLAGTKTQTRREVTRRNSVLDFEGCSMARWPGLDWSTARAFGASVPPSTEGAPRDLVSLHVRASGLPDYRHGEWTAHRIYPRWRPGERLWVRETWGVDHINMFMLDGIPKERPEWIEEAGDLLYRADGECCDQIPECCCATEGRGMFWRPSIHMPRWASRITLEITDVRVERLQSITEEDARAEGVDAYRTDPADGVLRQMISGARDNFHDLWESINGADSWNANPWVWVLSFRTVEVRR